MVKKFTEFTKPSGSVPYSQDWPFDPVMSHFKPIHNFIEINCDVIDSYSCSQENRPLVRILNHFNPIHFKSYFSNIKFNTALPSTTRFSKVSLEFRTTEKNLCGSPRISQILAELCPFSYGGQSRERIGDEAPYVGCLSAFAPALYEHRHIYI
jgi:hypothetical protein